jgi:hypothetical protein
MPQSFIVCALCGAIKLQFMQYAKHLKLHHENKPGFIVVCNHDGCKSSYKKVDSFTKHVRRHHESFFKLSCSNFVADSFNNVDSTFENVQTNSVTDNCNNVESTVDDIQMNCGRSEPARNSNDVQTSGCGSIGELVGNMHGHFADFILCIREQHSLPSLVQEKIMSNLHCTVTSALSDYSSVIKNQLLRSNVIPDDSLSDILNAPDQLPDVCKHFDTEYSLLRYLKETGKIICNETILLDVNKHKFNCINVLKL